MSFLSGLWIPFEALPPIVKAIAPFLPAYHLGQLALGAIGSGAGSRPGATSPRSAVSRCIGLALGALGIPTG